ncbi:MAG: DUF305 domain-containing protein [Janthinobacterium lividum]
MRPASLARGRVGIALCLVVVSAWSSPGLPADRRAAPRLEAEAPSSAADETAMDVMMAGMAVRPTGDVDADFAATMISHHQRAIAMAQAELRFGHDAQLRRIAQEIIVDQQQEIAAMRFGLGQPLHPVWDLSSSPPRSRPARPTGRVRRSRSRATERRTPSAPQLIAGAPRLRIRRALQSMPAQ